MRIIICLKYEMKYLDNDDDQIYYYRVPKADENETYYSPGFEGTGIPLYDLSMDFDNDTLDFDDDAFDSLLSPNPTAIIGVDERDRVENTTNSPYSSIICLEVEFSNVKGIGTAWMISPTNAITASHNVYNDKGEYAKEVTAYAGRNGSYTPFGSQRVIGVTIASEKYNPNFDYAIITLDTKI